MCCEKEREIFSSVTRYKQSDNPLLTRWVIMSFVSDLKIHNQWCWDLGFENIFFFFCGARGFIFVPSWHPDDWSSHLKFYPNNVTDITALRKWQNISSHLSLNRVKNWFWKPWINFCQEYIYIFFTLAPILPAHRRAQTNNRCIIETRKAWQKSSSACGNMSDCPGRFRATVSTVWTSW